MVLAMIYPRGKKGGDTRSAAARARIDQITESGLGFSRTLRTQARFVFANLPEVAQLVLAGTKPLGVAFAEAESIRQAAQGDEARMVPMQA
jgi:hypothetical protein